ncbi:MAG: phosphoribosylformylglycinamidine cyclo-ligase [Actinomycetia bacterium]|nr:phosphoribosylformylglycinamidine cyclo-ligase [Actinomycetes bacterium]
MKEKFSYKKTGVDIDLADNTKKEIYKIMETKSDKILHKKGAFASLYDASFPGYSHPVLVLKTEEPGSKQKLAFKYNRIEGICYDMVNHLINDIIVVGAKPLSVQDAIICGKMNKEVIKEIVRSIALACKEQDCILTGGETSEQPGVIDAGTYILTASIVGVVEKEKIIDGSKIEEKDRVIAVQSNGLHTNGYSLIRALIDKNPGIVNKKINGKQFLDVILKSHKCYWKDFSDLFGMEGLNGIAHITGGGIRDNLKRILPDNIDARIDLNKIKTLPVFGFIKNEGNIDDSEMLRTFNMGAGMIIISKSKTADNIINNLNNKGCNSYIIGDITKGSGKVIFENKLNY